MCTGMFVYVCVLLVWSQLGEHTGWVVVPGYCTCHWCITVCSDRDAFSCVLAASLRQQLALWVWLVLALTWELKLLLGSMQQLGCTQCGTRPVDHSERHRPQTQQLSSGMSAATGGAQCGKLRLLFARHRCLVAACS
jgi:hypothetical protein